MHNTRNKRFVPLVLWLSFVLLCAWIVAFKTDYRTDLSIFLPSDPDREELMVVGQIQNGAANRILLVGIEGADTGTLARIGKSFADTLRSNAAFAHVQNGQHVINAAEQELLYTYRYLLSPNTSAALFTAERLEESIYNNLQELSLASGLMSKALFMRDPTGEVMTLVDRLIPAEGPQTIEGQWFNDSGNRALLLVQLASAGTDIKAQELALQFMQTSFDEAVALFDNKTPENAQKTENLKIVISGPASFSVSTQQVIKSEISRLAGVALILIITILLVVLRNLKLLLAGLLPVLTGALAGIASVSLGFGSVHAMTIGFGITLIGESIDYAIYFFLKRSQFADNKGGFDVFWRTITLGVLTSICGFSTLLFSGFSGLMQLATFSIAGLLVSVICTRWVLPVLIPERLSVSNLNPVGSGIRQLIHKTRYLRYWIGFVALGALLLLMGRQAYLWSYELNDLSPIPTALLDLDGELRVDMGAADVRHMMLLQGRTQEEVLQHCEQFLPRLDKLVAQDLLQTYQAPCIILPSQFLQLKRQQALPDRKQLEQTLQDAEQALPVSLSSLHGFVDDVAASRTLPLLQADMLNESALAIALGMMLYAIESGDDTIHHALIQLQAPLDNGKAGSINQALLQDELSDMLNDQAVLLDLKDDFDSIYKTYLNKILKHSAAGFVAIVILLLIALRSLQKTAQVILPLACAMLFVTATLHLSGTQLNLLNVIGLLLVFAVGSNYALFFSSSQSDTTLASLLLAATTTITGYGILVFSQIPILQTIGMTVGSGVILAFVFSAVMSQQPENKASASCR